MQRRTLRLLFATQVISGVGGSIGITVGGLLAADMSTRAVSGLAVSAAVVGSALLAVPATRLMRAGGRRPGLVFGYLTGALGSLIVVVGATLHQLAVVLVGTFLFGGGTTASLQARYAAVDLAESQRRGRDLSLVVWATTVGAVTGPNLAPLADQVVSRWGLREYAGPFLLSALAFALAAVLLRVLLRPDPLLVARSGDGPNRRLAEASTPYPTRGGDLRASWHAVLTNPAARLGMAAVAVGHLVMVAVMSMTPVHIGEGGHHGHSLSVVGIVLSVHIAGMYALSPITGWFTDRLGRRSMILLGTGFLIVACGVAGLADHDTAQLSIGLFLLGLGWSATMVAGSTLLSESVDVTVRPAAQGLNDLVMGLAGASGAACSGLAVQFGGYPALTLISALATVPLLALAVRPIQRGT